MDAISQILDSAQILVVDDERVNRMMVSGLLELAGYNVLQADNGEQGLEMYRKHHPDIVLLDALMPVMDGFDCCTALRKLPNTESLPILMITGLNEESAMERAFEVGATDYITKPVNVTVLTQRIKRLLRAAKAERALRQSEKQYRSLVVNLEEIIFQTNSLGEFTFLNPAWKIITGFEIEESLGRNFIEYVHPIDVKRHLAQFENILQGKLKKSHYHMRYRMKSGAYGWIDAFANPLKTENGQIVGISGHLNNSTERRQREQYQRIAYCVARILSETLLMENTLYKVLQAICGNLNWKLAELWQLDEGTNRLICTQMWHLRSQSFNNFQKVTERTSFAPGDGLPGKVWETQEPYWIADLAQAQDFRRAAVVENAGLRTGFGFPVTSDLNCMGIMTFFSSEHRPIDRELLKLMTTLGRQIGQFMKRKEAEMKLRQQTEILQEELTRAAAYVQSLLPSPMEDKVKIQRLFIPSLQLGGDSFDYYWLDEEHLVIYLIDVAGHGVKSALISVSILNILRSQSLANVDFHRPASVLRELNKTFQMNEAGDDYFTIWYGVYNSKTRELTYSTGGHPPAILVLPSEKNFEIKKLATEGISIGMLEDWPYDEESCIVPEGSSLFVFSDGAYEIEMEEGKYWSLEDFSLVLQEYKRTSKQSLENILKQVQKINHSPSLEDDFSLLENSF